ncbi:4Fe-4S binding protein [Chloroflexota bacterium]
MKESEERNRANTSAPRGEISRRELLKMASPLGKIRLTGECTGCGLCVSECPTGALELAVNQDSNTCRLFFRQRCIACNQCVEICPEQCLSLEHGAALEKPGSPPVLLFEDEIISCAQCGRYVGTRTMITMVKAKILARQKLNEAQFELCPECKARARFSLPGK